MKTKIINSIKGKLKTTLIAMLMLSSLSSTKAQVTIGSGIAPMLGILLDLKEKQAGADNTTANKGLQMPRVWLTSRTNLYPMFDENDTNYQGEAKSTENKAHTGLFVFNMNTVTEENLEPNLYVWNGEEWKIVNFIPKKEMGPNRDPSIDSVPGRSGNEYKTYDFGNAGIWMTENLREIRYDTDIEPTSIRSPIIEGLNPISKPNARYYYYPNDDKALFQEHPEYGLLYSNVAANNGQVSERLYTGEYPYASRTQGICPNGWVLPTMTDWDQLKEELEAHPEKYSSNIIGAMVGATAKSPTKVQGSTSDTGGKSKPEGLNILMVGVFKENQWLDYGARTSFWTCTAFDDQNLLSRDLSSDVSGQHDKFNYKQSQDMYSVRCKKHKVKE